MEVHLTMVEILQRKISAFASLEELSQTVCACINEDYVIGYGIIRAIQFQLDPIPYTAIGKMQRN